MRLQLTHATQALPGNLQALGAQLDLVDSRKRHGDFEPAVSSIT
jgi:hypothetical protein